jgi:dUTP pyrophosphatase
MRRICTHASGETTLKEFLENVLGSLTTHHDSPYKKIYPISGADQAIDLILRLINCPFCANRLRVLPQDPFIVRYKKLHEGAKLPSKTYDTDVGWDLYALATVDLFPNTITEVCTGIALEMPHHLYATVDSRSSFGSMGISNHRSIYDPEYRGEITVFMNNTSSDMVTVKKWQRFAQLIFHAQTPIKFVVSDELTPSSRGTNALGSTGSF